MQWIDALFHLDKKYLYSLFRAKSYETDKFYTMVAIRRCLIDVLEHRKYSIPITDVAECALRSGHIKVVDFLWNLQKEKVPVLAENFFGLSTTLAFFRGDNTRGLSRILGLSGNVSMMKWYFGKVPRAFIEHCFELLRFTNTPSHTKAHVYLTEMMAEHLDEVNAHIEEKRLEEERRGSRERRGMAISMESFSLELERQSMLQIMRRSRSDALEYFEGRLGPLSNVPEMTLESFPIPLPIRTQDTDIEERMARSLERSETRARQRTTSKKTVKPSKAPPKRNISRKQRKSDFRGKGL